MLGLIIEMMPSYVGPIDSSATEQSMSFFELMLTSASTSLLSAEFLGTRRRAAAFAVLLFVTMNAAVAIKD